MKVFCIGSNVYGQLNSKEPLIHNMKPFFEYEVIKAFFISYSFSIILTSDDCWICLKNKLKSLPRKYGDTILHLAYNDERIILLNESGLLTKSYVDNLSNFEEIPSMLSYYESSEEKIINVSSCSKLTVAYSNKGTIFSIPNELLYNNPNIIDVKCGREHCLFLDHFGNVFSYGRGSRGQLGHGTLEDESVPVLIEALAGIKITQISAGGWHSGARSQDGDLYIWGWNGNGQIGLSTKRSDETVAEKKCVSVMATPHAADFENADRNVMKVACGSRHTIVLLDNNQLYGCGWNKYNQLKNVEEENIYTFTYLHDFKQEVVMDIICGPWNSAVICK